MKVSLIGKSKFPRKSQKCLLVESLLLELNCILIKVSKTDWITGGKSLFYGFDKSPAIISDYTRHHLVSHNVKIFIRQKLRVFHFKLNISSKSNVRFLIEQSDLNNLTLNQCNANNQSCDESSYEWKTIIIIMSIVGSSKWHPNRVKVSEPNFNEKLPEIQLKLILKGWQAFLHKPFYISVKRHTKSLFTFPKCKKAPETPFYTTKSLFTYF